jgi:hypothetical protein
MDPLDLARLEWLLWSQHRAGSCSVKDTGLIFNDCGCTLSKPNNGCSSRGVGWLCCRPCIAAVCDAKQQIHPPSCDLSLAQQLYCLHIGLLPLLYDSAACIFHCAACGDAT